ncbi:MAG: TetR/AcrR family transcriptional regulator [Ilumatobacteraceae bacterium]|jgi:TetR/AcrR family transcriptional regulator|nr:TetR/AcrR family transcriptional regulator [Ilumatobacteraceae bacterium]MDP4703395.1 TetR/AcrR family transcriptional regulator [Ilumatobacteraceae bacterium]MDP5108229.1 TetR/AcrR family transcriptional regulator [Ilumatobacteraceae bacterium]
MAEIRKKHAQPTRERILDAALDLFGSGGVDATSLDDIARAVGVAKQTVLYWFVTKEELAVAVMQRVADELVLEIGAAIRSAPHGFARIEATVTAVFRPAIRRPALLGLIRELNRLPPALSEALIDKVAPLINMAAIYLEKEMDEGRLRRADPHLLLAFVYSTVVGVATEPVALRAVGWQPTTVGLRALRRELLEFLRAALTP